MKLKYVLILLSSILILGIVTSSPWNQISGNSFVDEFNRPNNDSLGGDWDDIVNTGVLNASIIDNFLIIEDKTAGGQVLIHANSSSANVNFTHRFFEFRFNVTGTAIDIGLTTNIVIGNENTAIVHRIRMNNTDMDILTGKVIDGSDNFSITENVFFNVSLDINWTTNRTQWSVDGVPIGNLTFLNNGTRAGIVTITTGDPTTTGNLTIDYIQWGIGNTTEIIIEQDIPVNDFQSISNNVNFVCNATGILSDLANLSLFIDSARNFTNSTSGETISLNTNIGGLSFGSHNWACEGTNEANVTVSSSTRNFSVVNIAENSQTFNTSTFETATETFSINTTFNSTEFTTITGLLNYNGTGFLGTRTGTGNNAIFTTSVTIPIVIGSSENRTFNWIINLTNTTGINTFNSTFNNQSVDNIVLGLCNATITQNYINFTFRNETVNEENTNATIISTWTYFLGDGSINNTLSFSNSSINPSYAFCFTPPDRSVNTILELAYNNAESQQRIFSSTSLLSNVTTNQILYLLPTISGLFGQFRTESTTGNILALVQGTITRTLGGSIITVASDFTDSSGLVVYFLNPDVTYTGTFTLSGFADNIFTFVPVTDLRVVIMGGVAGTGVNGTEISINTSYEITPTNNSLNNNTNIVFGFNVTSAETITLISMNITNGSGSQIGFQSNSGQGFISQTINTGNQSTISGIYIIQTGTETITVTKTWIVGDEFVGEYSIFRQLTLYLDYGFTDFWRLLIVIIVIMLIIIFMSAGEITDTSESKIGTAMVLIWIFSIVGWLDNPIVVAQTGIAQFSKQYGIAILSTAAGLYFILRRLFIRRI